VKAPFLAAPIADDMDVGAELFRATAANPGWPIICAMNCLDPSISVEIGRVEDANASTDLNILLSGHGIQNDLRKVTHCARQILGLDNGCSPGLRHELACGLARLGLGPPFERQSWVQ
jgi:hypothetical protein